MGKSITVKRNHGMTLMPQENNRIEVMKVLDISMERDISVLTVTAANSQ
jgi:hypothetical protein